MLTVISAIALFLIPSRKENINFTYGSKPWITPEGSTTEKIIRQVKRCPSGALSYFVNDEVTGKG